MQTSDGYRANVAAHLIHTTDKAGRDVERLPPPLKPVSYYWWAGCRHAFIAFAVILIAGTIYARYFS